MPAGLSRLLFVTGSVRGVLVLLVRLWVSVHLPVHVFFHDEDLVFVNDVVVVIVMVGKGSASS